MNFRPAAAEHAYAEIKAGLLRGRFPPRAVLNVHTLAVEMGRSISPVRDAMGRLVGEHLVALRPEGGFQMPAMTDEIAADLYQWNARLLLWAVREGALSVASNEAGFSHDELDSDNDAIVAWTEKLFRTIATFSPSLELRRSVDAAADRLAPLRYRETMLRDRDGELRGIFEAASGNDRRRLYDAIVRYHHRRHRQVNAIVAMLHTPG